MAGSYNHVVEKDGNLANWDRVLDMLDTRGDVFEAIEEMYGMIWYLARQNVGELDFQGAEILPKVQAERMKEWVESARKNYLEGLAASKAVHKISPGTGGK